MVLIFYSGIDDKQLRNKSALSCLLKTYLAHMFIVTLKYSPPMPLIILVVL